MSFVEIGQIDEIPAGSMKSYSVDGKEVLIANIEGKFYAIGNKCSHAGGDLSKGHLEGKAVKCPRHGSQFDITTGKRMSGPAKNDVPAYEVKIEGIKLSIRI